MPDFENLKKALLCQGEPDRVPLFELTVDEEIKSPFLGRPAVSLEDEGLTATTRVDADSALTKGLDELFADLAANWHGWDGEKVGGTIDDSLFLSCRADKLGHTFIEVTLSQLGNWTVEANLCLDAAQLDRLAKQLKRFFRPALNAI